MDKLLVRRRFSRRLPEYRRFAVVQREMSGKLLRSVSEHRTDFPTVLEIGCGSGLLSEKLAAELRCRVLYLNDLVPECADLASMLENARFIPGDADLIDLPPALDLVISNAAMQWVEDPERLFRKVREALNPGGVFAFSSFAPGNLAEVAEVGGRALEYASAEYLKSLGEKYFKNVKIVSETRLLSFPSAREVLRHLRGTGVNALAQVRWSRKDLEAFCHRYNERFGSAEGGVTLTFKPLYFYSESVN